MKKILLLFLVILLAPTMIPSAEATQSIPAWDHTFTVAPGEYEAINSGMSSPYPLGIYGDFTSTNGVITFIITSEEDWDAFNDFGTPVPVERQYELMTDVESGTFEYLGAPDVSWMLIFYNSFGSTDTPTIQLSEYWDWSGPELTCSVEDNDALSGRWKFTLTASDMFGVEGWSYLIDASGYPPPFERIEEDLSSLIGDTYSFWLDTDEMENGDYYISIHAWDPCGNDRYLSVNFKAENEVIVSFPPLLTFLTSPVILGLGLVLICVGGIFAFRKRRKPTSEPKTPLEVTPEQKLTPEEIPSTSKITERTIEKVVLFMCPYCGAKNEQGITKCANCQADL